MIEVSNLVKKYGDHTAVDHLSFQIEKGKIYGFLGPNGAGKSTFIKVITGVHQAEEGEIFINGEKVEIKNPKDAQNVYSKTSGIVASNTDIFVND